MYFGYEDDLSDIHDPGFGTHVLELYAQHILYHNRNILQTYSWLLPLF